MRILLGLIPFFTIYGDQTDTCKSTPVDVVVGLRVDKDIEVNGLDLSEHGEVGYDM